MILKSSNGNDKIREEDDARRAEELATGQNRYEWVSNYLKMNELGLPDNGC